MEKTEIRAMTVGIVTVNQLDYLKRCLESLEQTAIKPLEIILVENGSEDETRTYLEEKAYEYLGKESVFEDSFIMRNTKNEGISVAWTQILSAAKYDRILICNDDILFPPKWQEHLVSFADNNDRIGIAGAWVYDSGQGEDRWLKEREEYEIDGRNRISKGMHGCCFMVKREMIEDLKQKELEEGKELCPGYPDRDYFCMWEDIDYVRRVEQKGWKVLTTHNCVFYHFNSKTIEALEEREKYYTEGRNLFAKKHNLPVSVAVKVNMSRIVSY